MSNTRVSSREIEGAIARGIQRQDTALAWGKLVVFVVFFLALGAQAGLGYLAGAPLYSMYTLFSVGAAAVISGIAGAWMYRFMLRD